MRRSMQPQGASASRRWSRPRHSGTTTPSVAFRPKSVPVSMVRVLIRYGYGRVIGPSPPSGVGDGNVEMLHVL